MKRFACTIALIASNLAPAYVHAQTAQPVVTIENGELRGQTEDGVESWKGIPFAAPPVGRFRWRAPRRATSRCTCWRTGWRRWAAPRASRRCARAA